MGCPTTSTDSYLGCVGVTPTYSEEQVSVYADRVGASGADWIKPMVVAMLRVNRLIYWKNTPNGLVGDCGQLTPASGGTGVKIAATGASVAGSGVGIAAGAGITTLAGVSTAILGAATAGVGLVLAPFLAIFAHHAQAVAIEQKTLCDVTVQYDQFAIAMEQALSSGQVPLQDALAQLKSVTDALANGLASIEKKYNAPYGYHKAVNALALFNTEVVYPSLKPGVLSELTSPSALLIGGGALVGAKVLGVL